MKPEGNAQAPEPCFEGVLVAAGRCAWRWDPIANMAICSDACADLFGLPHRTTIDYEGLLSTVHPDDRDVVKEAVQRALAGDGEYNVEYRVIWPDGTEHCIATKGRAEVGSVGVPVLMEGMSQEITERKRAEEALRASEERFRALAESAPIAILLTRSTGECTYANSTWTAISGLSAEASLDHGWMQAVHPGDREQLMQFWTATAARCAKCEIDYRVITPAGALRWLHALAAPQFDAAGSIVGYVSSLEDITERKHAEETVREWRDRYEAVIRASGHIVYDWDARTDYAIYGGSFEQTLGYGAAELAGGIADWLRIVHPEDAPLFDAELQRSLATKTRFHLAYRMRHCDGRYVVVQDDGYPILDAAGNVTRMVGLVEDITERRRAEQELRDRESQLSLIMNNVPGLVSRIDRNLRYLFASASYQRWFGLSLGTILGRTLPELVGEETFARAAPYVQRALNGERLIYENKFTTSFGVTRFSQITLVPDRDTEGNVQGLFVFVQDISEQKRVEHALAEAEARLRLALQAGRIGTFDWNMLSGQIIWSRGHEELWGMAQGAFTGTYEEFDAGLHPDDRAGLNRAVAQAMDERTTYRHDFRVVWPDGSVHWIAGQGQFAYDEAGKPIRMIGVVMDITERRRADEALRESEAVARRRWEELEQLYRSAPVGLFHLDREYRYVRVNRILADINGLPIEAHIGRSVREVLPELAETVIEVWRPLFERGEPVCDVEVRGIVPKAPHVQRDWLASYYPLKTEDGTVVGLLGSVVDITERKQAETLLAGQKRVLEMIAVGAPLGETLDSLLQLAESLTPGMLARIMVHDPNRAELRHGAAPSLPADYLAAIDRVPIAPNAGSCGASAFRRELVVVSDIATDPLWVDFRELGLKHGFRACWSTPIVGINGALLGTFAMYYREPKAPESHHLQMIDNITHTAAIAIERAQTEAALRHNQASLEAAQVQAQLGSWELDEGAPRKRWSQQMYRLFNRDPALGPPTFAEFLDLVHPVDRTLILDCHERIVAGSGPCEIEFRSNPALRPIRHFVARVDYVRDGIEPRRTIAGTLLDITERKRAEEDRLRLAAQLRQAQKMEALGTLAGGIAHDFNNVLAAIAGNAQLALAESPFASPAHTSIVEIERAAARAVNLVRQILAFSRREEAERRSLALPPVVKEALRLLRATLPAMIEIRVEFARALPEVSADATQIHQILMNLGANAAHAIGDRHGTLAVRVDPVALPPELAQGPGELHPGRYVRLSVSDSGCGMDEATRERIFDPFFTTKAPGQGTGLGLSVVHGIMQGHGGAVTVESVPGQGTTFHLYFPAVTEAIADVAARAVPMVTRGRGEHVLYVDDEEALVFLAERMFERLGYRVTAYRDAGQALQAFRARPMEFDLVVTDQCMPGMSGRDLARELLQIRPDVMILLMSGYLRPEDIDAARRLGVREVIPKPNTVGELSEVLDRLLRAPVRAESVGERIEGPDRTPPSPST